MVNSRTVGGVLDQAGNTVLGETPQRPAARPSAACATPPGAVIELTLDAAGKVISSRVVSGATGGTR